MKGMPDMFRLSLLLLISCIASSTVIGQNENLGDLFKVDYETPLTIDLEEDPESEEPLEPIIKKKKKKKKVFFGIKTKKGFTKTGFGKKQVFELFHYLKEYEEPPEYAREFYWYDTKKKKIINSLKIRKDVALVMHGHYIKKQGEQVLEEGYFFKGQKHGRWVRLNSYDILQDKKNFWKGWPEESLLAFYDFKREKVKEVIPVHFGERSGAYYAFHENGSVAVRGNYKFDYRVGLWREFYPNKATKKEIKFPDDPFDFKTSPYVMKEWDENGKVIYDRKKFSVRLN